MLIDKTLLESELMDCRAQRDQAQQQLTQANQAASIANTNIVGCSFVERQLLALIAKLETPDAPQPADPVPGDPVPGAPDRVRRGRRKRVEPDSGSANGSAPTPVAQPGTISGAVGQAGANNPAHALALADAQRDAGNANPLA